MPLFGSGKRFLSRLVKGVRSTALGRLGRVDVLEVLSMDAAKRYPLRSFHADPSLLEKGRLRMRYRCGINDSVEVFIVELDGDVLYLVNEPSVDETLRKAYSLVMDHIADTAPVPREGEKPMSFIERVVRDSLEALGLLEVVGEKLEALKYYVFRDVAGYGYIDVMMRDRGVEEISFVGPGVPVQVVHKGVPDRLWINTNVYIADDEAENYVLKLAQRCGRYISTAFPMLETPSPDKHRFALNLGEISGRGPGFVVRKFPENPYPITKLIEFGTLSPLLAAYLWLLMESNAFIMIIGPMASGKTTMLNVLLSTVRPDAHICTIEDVPELRLPHPGWDPLYTRRSYTVGQELEVDLLDLTYFALRRRCQVISIGEVRGEEIRALVQAAATGHGTACLPYDELVLARIDGRPQLVEIGKLVEGIDELGRVEVLSYNEASGEFEWKPVTRVYRVDTDAWIVIRTHEGRTIRVTPDHKIAALRDGKIVYKRADEVREGDVILLMKRLDLEARHRVWDLIEEATRLGLEDNLYVDARDYLVANPVAYGQLLKIYEHASDRRKRAFAPYAKVRGVIPRNAIRAVKYGAKARRAVKPLIPLDRNLGFIIGLYLAEGTIKGAEVRLCLGKDEVELANRLTQIVERVFGAKPRVYEKETSLIVSMPCKLLALIFKHLFGSRAEEKRLPHWMVFETPEEFIEGLVHGYWLGDGHIRRHGKSTYMALAVTASRTLAMQLHYALKRLGIDSSVRELPKRVATIDGGVATCKHTPYEVEIRGNESMKKFAIIAHLEEPGTSYTRSELIAKPEVGRVPENLLVDVVKEVQIIKLGKPEPSYDIEVADNHNFVFNASVLSSNCTFHSGSLRDMIARMTSPPLEVGPSYIKLIWAVVLMQWLDLGGRVVRRVRFVWEVLPDKPEVVDELTGRIEVVNPRFRDEIWYKLVFEWDPKSDRFSPGSAEELVERSYRLKLAAQMLGRDLDEIVLELRERAEFLDDLRRRGVFDWGELFREMRRFYARRSASRSSR